VQLLEERKAGIIAYGLQASLPTDRARRVSGARQQKEASKGACIIFALANLTATSSVVVLEDSAPLSRLAAVGWARCATSETLDVAKGHNLGSILEMRSARRSLREKAEEGMSELERDYPW